MPALVAVHVGFAVLAGAAYLVEPPARGWLVLLAVVAYGVALPLVARAAGRADWLRLWAVLAPLSVLQVLPDWALVEVAGTLAFPDLGGPRVGDAVPLAMAGMWVPPLFVALLAARGSAWRAAVAAVVVLGGAEVLAPVLGLWEPTGDLTEVAGVALYVLPAEALLGAAACLVVVHARDLRARLAGAAAVALLYTGALVVGLLLLDRARLVVA